MLGAEGGIFLNSCSAVVSLRVSEGAHVRNILLIGSFSKAINLSCGRWDVYLNSKLGLMHFVLIILTSRRVYIILRTIFIYYYISIY